MFLPCVANLHVGFPIWLNCIVLWAFFALVLLLPMLSREECSPAKGKFICPSLIISQIATKTLWKIMPSSMNAHVLIFVLGARLTLYVEFFHRSKEKKDEDCLQNHSYRYQPNSIRRNELAPLTITLWISMHFSTILYSLRPSSFFNEILVVSILRGKTSSKWESIAGAWKWFPPRQR